MIIALTGRAGSGKDTVATIVQDLYPELNWQIKGFADKLRRVASLLTGIPADEMKKQEVKEMILGDEWGVEISDENSYLFQVPTLRQLLQVLGTNAVRDKLHPNSWVNALMCDYKPIRALFVPREDFTLYDDDRIKFEWTHPNWLITDCRFPNELEAITSRGGICIRIVRPDNPYPKSNHPSETALDGVELLTIINDGNLEQLRIKVKEILDPIIDRLCAGSAS